MPHVQREYQSLTESVRCTGSLEQRMQVVVDACWTALRTLGVSWVGFYLDQPGEPDDRRLRLGPCRNKPACSPIGLHGVCGEALKSRQVRIIHDVQELGPNYIACDPRDRSEVVIPLIDQWGGCCGVFDVDSWEVGAFDASDTEGLQRVLRSAGLLA